MLPPNIIPVPETIANPHFQMLTALEPAIDFRHKTGDTANNTFHITKHPLNERHSSKSKASMLKTPKGIISLHKNKAKLVTGHSSKK